jgi:enoyl-CoA hydratase/carnithine racemase
LTEEIMNAVADSRAVSVECAAGVAWLTLNRPKSINAINEEIRVSVPELLAQLDRDPAIRVIVMRGAGERGFCVGADLKEDRPPDAPRLPWIESIATIRTPVIASIHGFCLGGGLEMALACDIRIASADASFSLPEATIGLIPGAGGTQRLPRLVGLGRALDALLTAERLDAAEAYRIGLVSRLYETRAALHSHTVLLAARIAALPPQAVRGIKETARSGLELNLAAGLALESTHFDRLLQTRDRQEAVAAFREKRDPIFTGE